MTRFCTRYRSSDLLRNKWVLLIHPYVNWYMYIYRYYYLWLLRRWDFITLPLIFNVDASKEIVAHNKENVSDACDCTP